MKRWTLLVRNVLLLAALIFLTMASDCRRQPPPPKPEIKSFSAQPSTVCTNLGLPLVTLSWEVSSPSKDTCMTIESTSGKSVLSSGSGPSTPVEGGRCGRDTWSRSMRVNVTELYGTNAPQTITFTGRLDEEAIGGQTGIDTKSASVTTKSDCTAGLQPTP
jgi:hypothetical protein